MASASYVRAEGHGGVNEVCLLSDQGKKTRTVGVRSSNNATPYQLLGGSCECGGDVEGIRLVFQPKMGVLTKDTGNNNNNSNV